MVLRILVPGLLLLTASFAPPAAADAPPPWADVARAAVVAWAGAHGADAAALLAMPLVLEVPTADGPAEVRLTVDEFLARVGRGAATQGAGAAGTPELTAGDLLHAYLNLRIGGSALAYRVHDSAVAPATPPVVLPPPATPLLFDVGGPLRNVAGTYLIGAHTAGTVAGSNVDTAASGPYLPVLHAAAVADRDIDFLGHAAVVQGQGCFFTICLAVGLLLGDGVAVWDTQDVQLPVVP